MLFILFVLLVEIRSTTLNILVYSSSDQCTGVPESNFTIESDTCGGSYWDVSETIDLLSVTCNGGVVTYYPCWYVGIWKSCPSSCEKYSVDIGSENECIHLVSNVEDGGSKDWDTWSLFNGNILGFDKNVKISCTGNITGVSDLDIIQSIQSITDIASTSVLVPVFVGLMLFCSSLMICTFCTQEKHRGKVKKKTIPEEIPEKSKEKEKEKESESEAELHPMPTTSVTSDNEKE